MTREERGIVARFSSEGICGRERHESEKVGRFGRLSEGLGGVRWGVCWRIDDG